MHKIHSAMLLYLVTAVSIAYADNAMDAAQIRQQLTNKTVDAEHHLRGISFSTYFAPNGKAIKKLNTGEIIEGDYYITNDGRHCINWGIRDLCAVIIDNGDGSYTRLNRLGKPVMTWRRVRDGKEM